MIKDTLYVGLDTDKKHIDVAVAEPLPGGEVRYWGKIANEAAALDRLIKRLQRHGRHLVVCYEAGPCGYGIYRRLNDQGVAVRVADHTVSIGVYFSDPDGNGLEVYYELPRSQWHQERPFSGGGAKGRSPGPWDEALRQATPALTNV